MIKDLSEIQQILESNKSDLAFIVGNGINRFAYGQDKEVSWSAILLDVWRHISKKTISNISNGISLTEFYDIMEFEAKSIDNVKQRVVDILEKWAPVEYHKWLQSQITKWNVPLLTTNFDRNLDNGLRINKLEDPRIGFTDFYPWNVYFSNSVLSSPTSGFAVWHINGMVGYRRSIRLSLSEYMGLSTRVRSFLHKEESIDDFGLKNQNKWKGYYTWLHIIFNKSLCIFGLALDENETFLRWLLIERAKYFSQKGCCPKKGWYVCMSNEFSEGKKMYLDYLGFEMVVLDDYKDIYERLVSF